MSQAIQVITGQRNSLMSNEMNISTSLSEANNNLKLQSYSAIGSSVASLADAAVGIKNAIKAKNALDADKIYSEKLDKDFNDAMNRILVDINNPDSGITYEDCITKFEEYCDGRINEVFGELGWSSNKIKGAKETLKGYIDKYASQIDTARVPLLANSIDKAMNDRIEAKNDKLASGETDISKMGLGKSLSENIMGRDTDIQNIFNEATDINAYKISLNIEGMSFEEGAKYIKENGREYYDLAKEHGATTDEEIVSYVSGIGDTQAMRGLYLAVLQDDMEDVYEFAGWERAQEYKEELGSSISVSIAIGTQSAKMDKILSNNKNSYDMLDSPELDKTTINPCTGELYTEEEREKIKEGIKIAKENKIKKDKKDNQDLFDNTFIPMFNERLNSGELMTSDKTASMLDELHIRPDAIDEGVFNMLGEIGSGYDNRKTIEDLIEAGAFSNNMPSNALNEGLRYYIYSDEEETRIGINSSVDTDSDSTSLKDVLALKYKPSVSYNKTKGAFTDQLEKENDELVNKVTGFAEDYYKYEQRAKDISELQDAKIFNVPYSTIPKNEATVDLLTNVLYHLGFDAIGEDGSMYRVEGDSSDVENAIYVIKDKKGRESKYSLEELYNFVDSQIINAAKVAVDFDSKTSTVYKEVKDYSDDPLKEKLALKKGKDIKEDVVQREENSISFNEIYTEIAGQLELRAGSDLYENFEREMSIKKAEVAPYSTELNKMGISVNNFNAKSLVDSQHQITWKKMLEAYEQNPYGVVKPSVTKSYDNGQSYLNYYIGLVFETNDDGTFKYTKEQLDESIKMSPYVSAKDTKDFCDANFDSLLKMASQTHSYYGSLSDAVDDIAKDRYGSNPSEAQKRTVASELLIALQNKDPEQSIPDFFNEVSERVATTNGRVLSSVYSFDVNFSSSKDRTKAMNLMGEMTLDGTSPYVMMGHNKLSSFDKYISEHKTSDYGLLTLMTDPEKFVENDDQLRDFCYYVACNLNNMSLGINYLDDNFGEELGNILDKSPMAEMIAGDAGALYSRIQKLAELKKNGWDIQSFDWVTGSASGLRQSLSSEESPISISSIREDGLVEGTENVKASSYTTKALANSMQRTRNELSLSANNGLQKEIILNAIEQGEDINGILYGLCGEAQKLDDMNMQLIKAGAVEYVPTYTLSYSNRMSEDEADSLLDELLNDLDKQFERGTIDEATRDARKKELEGAKNDPKYIKTMTDSTDFTVDIKMIPASEYISAKDLYQNSQVTVRAVYESNSKIYETMNR